VKIEFGHTQLFLENKTLILRSNGSKKDVYFSHLETLKIHHSNGDLEHMIPWT
jgi:hypothetical protein